MPHVVTLWCPTYPACEYKREISEPEQLKRLMNVKIPKPVKTGPRGGGSGPVKVTIHWEHRRREG